MRILEAVEHLAQQAQQQGGRRFLTPEGILTETQAGVPAGADPHWRPAPNPANGSLLQDPEFSLPTTAAPVTWRLFYDTGNATTDSEWGYGRRASFPLRLRQSGTIVTVMHEDGVERCYTQSGGGFVPVEARNGDTLVQNGDGSWDETAGDTGLVYHYPAGSYVSLQYRATRRACGSPISTTRGPGGCKPCRSRRGGG